MKMERRGAVLQEQLTIIPHSFSVTIAILLLSLNVKPKKKKNFIYSSKILILIIMWSNTQFWLTKFCFNSFLSAMNQIISRKRFCFFPISLETSIRSAGTSSFPRHAWFDPSLVFDLNICYTASACRFYFRQGRQYNWCSLVHQKAKSSPCESNCQLHPPFKLCTSYF